MQDENRLLCQDILIINKKDGTIIRPSSLVESVSDENNFTFTFSRKGTIDNIDPAVPLKSVALNVFTAEEEAQRQAYRTMLIKIQEAIKL